ncbi:hypothetical protein CBR_g19723 [Chara braunii]|uniref:BHLH domain-containing protein n=1 Tax=Chara braunii TaxID=69332 RepID=A0A388JTT1_CHABU|nr:hypothetical protein CBR_g19723 [Chara braunii]|eukprot:GBG61190.1 hypothetical protein CBR_g19723 [Chara braunii]
MDANSPLRNRHGCGPGRIRSSHTRLSVYRRRRHKRADQQLLPGSGSLENLKGVTVGDVHHHGVGGHASSAHTLGEPPLEKSRLLTMDGATSSSASAHSAPTPPFAPPSSAYSWGFSLCSSSSHPCPSQGPNPITDRSTGSFGPAAAVHLPGNLGGQRPVGAVAYECNIGTKQNEDGHRHGPGGDGHRQVEEDSDGEVCLIDMQSVEHYRVSSESDQARADHRVQWNLCGDSRIGWRGVELHQNEKDYGEKKTEEGEGEGEGEREKGNMASVRAQLEAIRTEPGSLATAVHHDPSGSGLGPQTFPGTNRDLYSFRATDPFLPPRLYPTQPTAADDLAPTCKASTAQYLIPPTTEVCSYTMLLLGLDVANELGGMHSEFDMKVDDQPEASSEATLHAQGVLAPIPMHDLDVVLNQLSSSLIKRDECRSPFESKDCSSVIDESDDEAACGRIEPRRSSLLTETADHHGAHEGWQVSWRCLSGSTDAEEDNLCAAGGGNGRGSGGAGGEGGGRGGGGRGGGGGVGSLNRRRPPVICVDSARRRAAAAGVELKGDAGGLPSTPTSLLSDRCLMSPSVSPSSDTWHTANNWPTPRFTDRSTLSRQTRILPSPGSTASSDLRWNGLCHGSEHGPGTGPGTGSEPGLQSGLATALGPGLGSDLVSGFRSEYGSVSAPGTGSRPGLPSGSATTLGAGFGPGCGRGCGPGLGSGQGSCSVSGLACLAVRPAGAGMESATGSGVGSHVGSGSVVDQLSSNNTNLERSTWRLAGPTGNISLSGRGGLAPVDVAQIHGQEGLPVVVSGGIANTQSRSPAETQRCTIDGYALPADLKASSMGTDGAEGRKEEEARVPGELGPRSVRYGLEGGMTRGVGAGAAQPFADMRSSYSLPAAGRGEGESKAAGRPTGEGSSEVRTRDNLVELRSNPLNVMQREGEPGGGGGGGGGGGEAGGEAWEGRGTEQGEGERYAASAVDILEGEREGRGEVNVHERERQGGETGAAVNDRGVIRAAGGGVRGGGDGRGGKKPPPEDDAARNARQTEVCDSSNPAMCVAQVPPVRTRSNCEHEGVRAGEVGGVLPARSETQGGNERREEVEKGGATAQYQEQKKKNAEFSSLRAPYTVKAIQADVGEGEARGGLPSSSNPPVNDNSPHCGESERQPELDQLQKQPPHTEDSTADTSDRNRDRDRDRIAAEAREKKGTSPQSSKRKWSSSPGPYELGEQLAVANIDPPTGRPHARPSTGSFATRSGLVGDAHQGGAVLSSTNGEMEVCSNFNPVARAGRQSAIAGLEKECGDCGGRAVAAEKLGYGSQGGSGNTEDDVSDTRLLLFRSGSDDMGMEPLSIGEEDSYIHSLHWVGVAPPLSLDETSFGQEEEGNVRDTPFEDDGDEGFATATSTLISVPELTSPYSRSPTFMPSDGGSGSIQPQKGRMNDPQGFSSFPANPRDTTLTPDHGGFDLPEDQHYGGGHAHRLSPVVVAPPTPPPTPLAPTPPPPPPLPLAPPIAPNFDQYQSERLVQPLSGMFSALEGSFPLSSTSVTNVGAPNLHAQLAPRFGSMRGGGEREGVGGVEREDAGERGGGGRTRERGLATRDRRDGGGEAHGTGGGKEVSYLRAKFDDEEQLHVDPQCSWLGTSDGGGLQIHADQVNREGKGERLLSQSSDEAQSDTWAIPSDSAPRRSATLSAEEVHYDSAVEWSVIGQDQVPDELPELGNDCRKGATGSQAASGAQYGAAANVNNVMETVPPVSNPELEAPAVQEMKPKVKRGQATDPQSVAARMRRERISKRMKILSAIVMPNAIPSKVTF